MRSGVEVVVVDDEGSGLELAMVVSRGMCAMERVCMGQGSTKSSDVCCSQP